MAKQDESGDEMLRAALDRLVARLEDNFRELEQALAEAVSKEGVDVYAAHAAQAPTGALMLATWPAEHLVKYPHLARVLQLISESREGRN
jgi:hypothetical protein